LGVRVFPTIIVVNRPTVGRLVRGLAGR